MFKLILVVAEFLLLITFPFIRTECDWNTVRGYYWRDYTGFIPKDAYPAGNNSNGATTYIGQVLHKNQLIPAKIDPEANKVTYEWGYTEFEAKKNIKVLCTLFPEQFQWVKTGNGLINNITEKNFLVGGYEEGVTLFIGRKQLCNELVVGKVVYTKKQSTLNTSKNGTVHQHAAFEVLSYEKDPEIDIRFTIN